MPHVRRVMQITLDATPDLARQAAELYQRAVAAQRGGDWARYGEALSQLGEVLRQLQAVFGGRQP